MDTIAVMKALADDVRLDIVRHLARESKQVPSCDVVSSCSEALDLAQPTMSHHLAKLVGAGVLSEQKIGTQKFYQLNSDRLRAVGIEPTKL